MKCAVSKNLVFRKKRVHVGIRKMPILSFKINYLIFLIKSSNYLRMHIPEQKIIAEYGSREPACALYS